MTPRMMTLNEVRTWAAENAATRCIGAVMLPTGHAPQAVMAVTDTTIRAVVPYWGMAAVYEQVWNGTTWTTAHIGDIDGDWDDLDVLFAALFECPRCDGTGVIEDATRYGAFVVSDTAPCPQCVAPPTNEPLF